MRLRSHGETPLALFERPAFYFRARQILKYLTDCELIIDFGCGYQADFLRQLLKKRKVRVAIGIDLSVDSSIINENLELVKADLNQPLALPDERADYIISQAILEHLAKPLLNLQEAYRLLKPKGKLILTTPTRRAKPLLEFLSFKLNLINQEEIRDHKNYFTSGQLRDLLLQAGFSSDKIILKKFLFNLNNLAVAEK